MGSLLGKNKIKVGEEGLKLEDIPKDSLLIFPDGRKDLVEEVDILAHTLYTERIKFTRDWKITEKVRYYLKPNSGESNILLPNNEGEIYAPSERRAI